MAGLFVAAVVLDKLNFSVFNLYLLFFSLSTALVALVHSPDGLDCRSTASTVLRSILQGRLKFIIQYIL